MTTQATSAIGLLLSLSFAGIASAQTPSRCLAMAQSIGTVVPVAYTAIQDEAIGEDVTIRFVGHSTFLITSPGGVTIATDYNGYAGTQTPPRVVTMNHAHGTHYTDTPDPAIEYVLRGWNPDGGPAEHHLTVGDVLIRNVPTDARSFGFEGGRVPDGNSIFIFETARLCIGHLGHLHHVLDTEDLGHIGQLDIVMVPVDGSYTMDQASMVQTLDVLKARLILPMHYFGTPTLQRFVMQLGEHFAVEVNPEPEITVSAETLPDGPTVLVLPGY